MKQHKQRNENEPKFVLVKPFEYFLQTHSLKQPEIEASVSQTRECCVISPGRCKQLSVYPKYSTSKSPSKNFGLVSQQVCWAYTQRCK